MIAEHDTREAESNPAPKAPSPRGTAVPRYAGAIQRGGQCGLLYVVTYEARKPTTP